jgi:hypothetical protein
MPRSSDRGYPQFLRFPQPGSLPNRPDPESFRTRRFPQRRRPKNRVRKRRGRRPSLRVVRLHDKSWDALHRVRKVQSPDQERGKARRWRTRQSVLPPPRLRPTSR